MKHRNSSLERDTSLFVWTIFVLLFGKHTFRFGGEGLFGGVWPEAGPYVKDSNWVDLFIGPLHAVEVEGLGARIVGLGVGVRVGIEGGIGVGVKIGIESGMVIGGEAESADVCWVSVECREKETCWECVYGLVWK